MKANVTAPDAGNGVQAAIYFNGEEVPKWQYRRERFPKQEEIKDARLFGSFKRLHSADAPTVASLPLLTRFARTAAIIRV